jgi:hypothetical protein
MKFEYVASGCSFFKLIYKESRDRETNLSFFENSFGSCNGYKDHHVSLLYNAHTEKGVGAKLKDAYLGRGCHRIYADSGGLQAVTLGQQITDEFKDNVYRNQATSSNIGMSFDEIPVRIIGDKSVRLDLEFRKYDPELLETCARQSGKNLRRQIEVFLEEKTETKPMLITQGNCYDSYMKWVEYMLDEMPQEYTKYIAGIAMGAAALGQGTLEDIKRGFYYTQLPIELEHKHMHLLGVGSVYRMLPNIIFMQSGLYEDVWLSYDSTTHTSGSVQGRYYMKERTLTFNRVYDDAYRKIHADLTRNFPDYQYDVDTLYECLNISSRTYEEKHGNIDPSIQTYVGYVASSIKNFIDHAYRISRKKEAVIAYADKKDKNTFNALYDVKTKDDFDHWLKWVGPHVSSAPVEPYMEPVSLEDLFA